MPPIRLCSPHKVFDKPLRVKRSCGFTLVEMLISLVLSAIIFVSAYQVISNLIQYQVRYAEKTDKQLDRLLIRNLIDQIMRKGLHQGNLFYRIQKEPLFKGSQNTVRILSRAFSDHFDVPGYRVYSLYVADGELFVSYTRYDKESLSMTPVNQTSGIRIEKIAFEYLKDGEWVEQWREGDKIPGMIKVKVTMPDNATFEWISPTGKA
jgi:prepilin-type N-terminal cleavage/methylation domain-containing protein